MALYVECSVWSLILFAFASVHGDWELILNVLLNHHFIIFFVTNNGDALCFWFSEETQCVVMWVVSVCQDIALSWRVDVQLEAVYYPPTRLHDDVSQKAVICIFSSCKCRCLFMFLFVYANAVWPVLAIARGCAVNLLKNVSCNHNRLLPYVNGIISTVNSLVVYIQKTQDKDIFPTLFFVTSHMVITIFLGCICCLLKLYVGHF